MIDLLDPIAILSEGEVEIVVNASEFLKSGVPAKDMESTVNAYVGKGLRLKEDVSNLKAQVSYTQCDLWHQVVAARDAAAEDLVDQYTKAEVRELVYKDPKFREVKLLHDGLKILEQRLESLQWDLKLAIDFRR